MFATRFAPWRHKGSGNAGRRAKAPARPRGRPRVEELEGRWVPATITVIGNLDGPGVLTPTGPDTFTDTTLRGAIEAANGMPGADTIHFQIAPGGVQTITPASA